MRQILVVDDEHEVCRSLQEYLSLKGYEVAYATTGEAAWEIIRHQPPMLVLLDICLPGMGGVELLVRLKDAWPDLPVLMVTAVNEQELGRQTLKLGALDYITKPIDLSYLETSILASLFAH